MRKNRRGALALAGAALALSALTLPAAAASTPAGDVTIQSTDLNVSVSCQPGGSYGWNATIVDGKANGKYGLEAKVSVSGGGHGGDFDYKYVGVFGTGALGIGSSSTYYGSAGASTEKVTVNARASLKGGTWVYGSGSDTC